MAISPMDDHMNQGGPYTHHNNSNTALSNTASFDSYSSGDSTTSWDAATPSPSRSDFFGNYDRDSFSASPGPMFTGSLGHQFNVTSNHGPSMADPSFMYPESFHRSMAGQDHMTYELHAPLPLPIGSPAFLPEQHYVSPGQTCFDPSQPTPPPLDGYSPYDDQPRYYMSPVQATSHPSHSTPSSYTIYSSAPALPPPINMRRRHHSRRARKHPSHSPTIVMSDHGYEATKVPAGHFECTQADCKSKGQKFKRQEHLKRHMLTHTQPRDVGCPFCPKRFQENRKDNLKAHLLLHSKPNADRKRTAYAEGAAEALARLGGLGKKGDWGAERGDVKAICEQARRKGEMERGM